MNKLGLEVNIFFLFNIAFLFAGIYAGLPACHITQLERQDFVELLHTLYIILLFLLLFRTWGAIDNPMLYKFNSFLFFSSLGLLFDNRVVKL